MPAVITLKRGREQSLLRRHPWVFSGAVASVSGEPEMGGTVDIVSSRNEWLARGAFSPQSQIRTRVWTFRDDEEVCSPFFEKRIVDAIELRRRLQLVEPSTACRLINAEGDGIPGLVVDRYADLLVCQFLSAGAEKWRDTIVDILKTQFPTSTIYERSDADVREKEGLPSRTGVLVGSEPPDTVEICEDACRYLVNVKTGHKTGFYLDQRENRAAVAAVARDRDVLNCFAYTGGFGIAAARAGAASVLNVEASADALEQARQNAIVNSLPDGLVENMEADVFTALRRFRDSRRQFGLIVLDPPKFATSRGSLERAARGYKDINLLALKLLAPGGILVTFSCSGVVPPELFHKIVADAAADAQRDVRVLRRLNQAPDHPWTIAFPEGHYLKGLVCRAD